MNANEFGVTFAFFTGYNMMNQTKLSLAFTRPDSSTFTVQSPKVTLGILPLVTATQGTFPPNQYAQYTFAQGDVTQSGAWSARLIYDDPSLHLISAPGAFTVNP